MKTKERIIQIINEVNILQEQKDFGNFSKDMGLVIIATYMQDDKVYWENKIVGSFNEAQQKILARELSKQAMQLIEHQTKKLGKEDKPELKNIIKDYLKRFNKA